MITKALLERTVKEFPDRFSIEELIDKLILLDKIEKAEGQSNANDVINEEELDAEMKKWFK